MLPWIDSNISWKSSANACGEELHCRRQLIDPTGLPTKHSSWWRGTEDVLSITFFCLSRRNRKTSSWRCLEDLFKKTCRRHLASKCWRRLEEVLKAFVEDALLSVWSWMEVLENKQKKTKMKLWKIQFSDDFFHLSHIGKKFFLVTTVVLNYSHWLRKSIAIGRF